MRWAGRFFLLALATVVGLTVLLAAAWAVDARRSEGKVNRNVTLAGRDVSGLSRPALAAVVADLSGGYTEVPVRVVAAGGGFSMAPGDIGMAVDESATVDAAFDVGRGGNPLGRLRDWAVSFVDPRKAPVAVRVDRAAVYRVVAASDTGRTPPTEPSVTSEKGRLVVVEGEPGRGIDPAAVLDALPRAARHGPPVTVRAERGAIPPRFPVAEARRLVGAGEAATAQPLAVTVDGDGATIEPDQLRTWLDTEATDTGLRLVVDAERARASLDDIPDDVGTPPVETRFEVVGGTPQIVPGRPGAACCGNEAGAKAAAAIEVRLAGAPPAEPVALPVKAVDPRFTAEEAAALGIKEQVGTFTTNHAPRQPRVSNIHRIADLVRGQFIRPGKTFSINDFVGERTTEKGFVVDAVIEDGKFTESVGGGISQFATTTFNAAFFAGLEFPEYQSHSIYISRYPFGREATLSYPHPDLKLRNPSPYGVLIWPTYSERSITVTLYSTRWVDVAQTNQTREQRGPCTRVRTERTRKLLSDGTTKIDHVGALYRPAEGVNCT